MKFIIKDWANNTLFEGREFSSFEDAWGFIYETFPDEGGEDGFFDEYFVEEKGEQS